MANQRRFMGRMYSEYARKFYVGYGGWTCACCTWSNPRDFKPRSRKMVRRNMKAELRRDTSYDD